MKNKNLLALALIFCASTLFGQVIEPVDHKFDARLETSVPEFPTGSGTLNKREVSGWYNYVSALRENNEGFSYLSDVLVWPDSLPVVTYADGATNPAQNAFAHSVGQVYDPNSFYFVDPELFDSRYVSYTIDSIAFFFKYHNFGDYTDSVRIQCYDPTGIIRLTWNAGGESRSVSYNKTKGIGSNEADQFTLALDSSNNTPTFFINASRTYSGTIQIPVNIPVTPKAPFSAAQNLFAVTVKFEPGNPNYKLGDTLNRLDSTIMDGNQPSVFAPYYLRGDGAASAADPSYNHGLMLYTWGMYGSSNNFWYPMAAPGQPRSHLNTFFHVTASNVSVEELNENGFGLGKAYPNPASNKSELNIPFALGNGEMVSLNILDLQGRVVKQVPSTFYANGEHNVAVDISDLSAGVYVYEMKAGSYTGSNRVIVK